MDDILSITVWLKLWLRISYMYVCDAKDFKHDIWPNLNIN